jgi:hypothetical protein
MKSATLVSSRPSLRRRGLDAEERGDGGVGLGRIPVVGPEHLALVLSHEALGGLRGIGGAFGERTDFGEGLVAVAQDDRLAGLHALRVAREVGLGLVDVDLEHGGELGLVGDLVN